MRVSAYIPCYNSEETIRDALLSLREQSLRPDELFVVDDGSTDGSDKIPGVKIFRLGSNRGRGAARSKAMQEAQYELVLGCDASLVLDRSFLSRAVTWFEDETVAAVFGGIKEAGSPTVPNRWRDRHLFRSDMARGISWEMLQRSGLIALVAFLVNSLIDVPGHRLGTVLPILVLAGICTRPPLFGQDGKVLRWGSRLLGIGLIAFGVFLVRELDVSARTQRAIVAENWPGAEKAISESLRRTPLIWSLYVKRSYAAINQGRWSQAISDFYYARVLEPKLAIVPFSEGKAWVGVNRALALAAWKETLRRSKGAERRDLYGQMLDACAEDSHLHLLTVRLADTRPSLAVLALDHGNIDPKTLEALESARPELNPDKVLALTRAEAWKAAADKDFERAYQLGKQSMRPVVFPERSVQSEVECRNALSRDRHDFAAAFNLCSMLQSQERWQDALQVLEPITRLSQCPDYFLVMKSEIFAAQQNWLEAWTAINERVR